VESQRTPKLDLRILLVHYRAVVALQNEHEKGVEKKNDPCEWAGPIEAAYDGISGKKKLQGCDKAIQDLYRLAQSYILDIKLFTEHITEQSTVEGYFGICKDLEGEFNETLQEAQIPMVETMQAAIGQVASLIHSEEYARTPVSDLELKTAAFWFNALYHYRNVGLFHSENSGSELLLWNRCNNVTAPKLPWVN